MSRAVPPAGSAPTKSAHHSASFQTRGEASGTAAAAALGAPVVSTTSVPDLYVPGPVVVTIAARRFGIARDATVAAASIAVAPVTAVTAETVGDREAANGWRLAHPVAVALDLAQDRSRGREILDGWEPIGIERVW